MELGKCRGLLQGLLAGLTLAPALEMQVGTMGQAWAIPSLGPPQVSRASGRVLVGCCGASLSLSGYLRGVSPANRTRPVGLQPLVNTLGVELMVTGEDSEQLPCLEVTEADHTQRLL